MNKIMKLHVENIKRLKVVDLEPDQDAVIVSGKNEQGKSSLMDSIIFALTGKTNIPGEPIRKGAKNAHIILELNDIVVKRIWTNPLKSSLFIESKINNGAVASSPQRLLDKLLGEITFDPTQFLRESPAEQFRILSKIVGFDESVFIDRINRKSNERLMVGRDRTRYKAILDGMQVKDDFYKLPDSEIDIQVLFEEQKERQAELDKYHAVLRNHAGLRETLRNVSDNVQEKKNAILKLEKELQETLAMEKSLEDRIAAFIIPEQPDVNSVAKKLENALALNKRIAEKQKYIETENTLSDLHVRYEELTQEIADIERERIESVSTLKFPVDGLTIENNEIRYKGIPYEQCSTSEQLWVAMAIGASLNPDLRVMLLKEGAFLDDDKLNRVREFAKEHNIQIWVETVGERADSVIIEDGMVK